MYTTEQRLERLEKTNKRYRFITIALLCLMTALVSMGQGSGPQDIVVKSIKVVDDGKTVMSIVPIQNSARISTYLTNGKPQLLLGSFGGGGEIVVVDKNGKERRF